MNLPYSVDYDVSMPRVMLIHKDGELATHCAIFVDDIHPSGHAQKGDENTKRACKQPKSRMNLRGRRAGDRKHREPSPTPGAWNGGIINTDNPFPRKSKTQKKWTRLRSGLDWIRSVSRTADVIDTSKLRQWVGLAVHMTEVYSDARPYLKGVFNAIEPFCWDQDLDGWRLHQAMVSAMQLETDDASRVVTELGYPRETQLSSEMLLHVEAFLGLCFLLKFPTLYLFGPLIRRRLGMLLVMLQPKDLDLGHNIRILPLKEGMDSGK